nr:hypothetical protein GTC16762_06300 [Pigmentibacter ruber]
MQNVFFIIKKNFLKIILFFIFFLTLFYLFFLQRLPEDKKELEIVSVNLGEIKQIPWDLKQAPIQVNETFVAAVHGSLTSVHSFGSIDNSKQNTLLEKYYCEQLNCYLELKQNIYFHNKRKVNAYDVEFSFVKQILKDKSESFTLAILNDVEGINKINYSTFKWIKYSDNNYPTNLVSGIKVINATKLQIKLRHFNKYFFHKLSQGRLPIVPIEELQSDYETWKKYPIGFGKYKVTYADIEKSEYLLEKYDKNEKIPDKIFLFFSDTVNGDINMLLGNPLRKLPKDDHILVLSNFYSNGGFLYNFQTELGRNENFRKAISYALDRHKIAKASHINEIFPEDQLLSNSDWQMAYRFPRAIQKQDLAKAKYYLAKVPKHLWLNKLFEIPTYWEDVKQIYSLPYIKEMHKQLEQLGLKVKFLDTNIEYDKFIKDDKNILWFTGFGISFVSFDPNANFAHFIKGSYFTYEQPNDPIFNAMYEQSTRHYLEKPFITQQMSKYFADKNFMTVVMNQRMSLSFNPNKIISLGNQYNGIRFALWELKLRH